MGTASVIAIDGPAASGKSTLARRLAEALGYLYFDTGVMYRAVTLAALERGLPLKEDRISQLAESMEIDVLAAPGSEPPYQVLVDGQDVTDQLRTQQVDDNVSQISTYARVRQAMTARQRDIGMRGEVVMVGRDIGTVVLPDADLKIYLDATVEARARRRWQELEEANGEADFGEVLASMKSRDRIDSGRSVAPLKEAEDAVHMDNTELTIEETVENALALVRAAN